MEKLLAVILLGSSIAFTLISGEKSDSGESTLSKRVTVREIPEEIATLLKRLVPDFEIKEVTREVDENEIENGKPEVTWEFEGRINGHEIGIELEEGEGGEESDDDEDDEG